MKITEYVLYHSAGNLYWKDKDFKYLGCNENFLRIAGLRSKKEIIGKTDREMFLQYLGEEGIQKLREVDYQVIYGGIDVVCEETGINENGEIAIFLTKKLPLRDARGNIIGLIGTSIDITKQKNLEEQKKYSEDELKKVNYQFEGAKLISGSIAHEIRTPLATIKLAMHGLSQTISKLISINEFVYKNKLEIKTISNNEIMDMKDAINSVNKKVDQSNTIINMLLTKLQNIDFEAFKPTICSASHCVQDALTDFIVPDNVKNKISFNKDNDFEFSGNHTLIMHALMNLLKNAIFYILKARKGEIIIWLEQHKTNNEIHFKDTGTGISPQVLPHIFDSFFTTESSTGTGVGLAFSKMVMQSHQGGINCLSKEGEYTEFILSFPKLNK